MNKNCFIVFLLITFIFSCSKNKRNDDIYVNNDSLILFLKNRNNNILSDKELYLYTNSALNYIDNTSNNDSLIRNSLFKIVESSNRLGKTDLFKKSNKLLLRKSIEKNDTLNIANSYFNLANYFFEQNFTDSAYFYYLKAEKFYLKKTFLKNLGSIYLNKALILLEINDLYGAEYSATQSLKYLKNNNDALSLYDANTCIGIIANESENYDKAIEYHKKALEIAENYTENSNYFLKEVSLNNIGNTYQNSKKFADAIIEFEKALLNKKLAKYKPSLYATLIDNIAYSKFKQNNYKNLPKLFFKSLKIRDSLKLSSKIIFSKIHLSEFFFYKNDTINATKFANEALIFSRKTKSPLDVLASLKQLSIVDKSKSTKFSNEYYKLSDSLQVAERNSKDRFARIEFETDELKQKNVILEEKNRDVLNYLFGIILFFVVVYYFRVQRSKARELVLKQAHQQANEEIYRLIISHQNQLEEGRDLEKKRLSKELHDGVLGRLFGLRLNLDGLNSFDDEDAKQQRLDYLNELQIIEQDLRDISHELSRENLVLINNFVAILNRLVEEQAKVNTAKIKIIISDDIQWDKVSNMLKINMYRILQEAFQNINKHAKAKNIFVTISKDKNGNLLFEVGDDGIGFDLTDKRIKGIGTKNIVSRTQQCKGIIDIKSEIGVGSKIIITFPLDNLIIKI